MENITKTDSDEYVPPDDGGDIKKYQWLDAKIDEMVCGYDLEVLIHTRIFCSPSNVE